MEKNSNSKIVEASRIENSPSTLEIVNLWEFNKRDSFLKILR